VRVSVHGVGYAGVAQYLLDNLGVFALFEHESGEGVPEVVGAVPWGRLAARMRGLRLRRTRLFQLIGLPVFEEKTRSSFRQSPEYFSLCSACRLR